ncbi:MAG: beta-glucosidase BglX [Bacteroidales bacterium]|nr:beta-glucosidase BglX [Bacteroidales bacterium]
MKQLIKKRATKQVQLFLLSLLLMMAGVSCQNGTSEKGKVSSQKGNRYDAQIRKLMSKMTLEEKIGQLNMLSGDGAVTGPITNTNVVKEIKEGHVGAMLNCYTASYTRKLMEIAIDSTRLHIPLLFGYDVIHGERTIFPIPLGESCSWDLKLMEKTARIAAIEASAEGVQWTFAPMVDIARDPRWGRVMEGAGEDPWYGSLVAKAKVRGFQGNDLSNDSTILACVKHGVAYGAPIAGRDYNTVDMSMRTLLGVYMPPYHAAVEAGVATAMSAFNDLNGTPCTANSWIWNTMFRKEWGFKGFVVSDYTSINELIPHGVAKNLFDADVLAFNAGVDMDMVGNGYIKNLKKAVEEGLVSEKEIDSSVYRILKAKFELGLFDNPYKYCNEEREKNDTLTPQHLAVAREDARESMVLLKNSDHLLPFSKKIKSIAIIGPLGNDKSDMIGSWSAAGDRNTEPVSLLEGIKNKLGNKVRILYAKGTDIDSHSTEGFAQAVSVAKEADVVLLALGEGDYMTGEASSRANIDLPGNQRELADAVIKANKRTAVVLMNGRPLTISHLNEVAPAILEAWFSGTEAGNAIADVVFGDYNPSGKLTMTFPRCVGQIPIFYSHMNTGRPYSPTNHYTTHYLDCPNTPLYPFGYGLSYTKFQYDSLKVDKKVMTTKDTLRVSVVLKNVGNYDGTEVAQLYIRDMVGSVTRPVKELRGFKRVFLKKGESKKLVFKLTNQDLSFYRKDMTFGSEPGSFEVFVGGNSATQYKTNFVLK